MALWELRYKSGSKVQVRANDYDTALRRGREISPKLTPRDVVMIDDAKEKFTRKKIKSPIKRRVTLAQNPVVGNRYSVRVNHGGKSRTLGNFNTRKEAEAEKKKLVAHYKRAYSVHAQPKITIYARKSRKRPASRKRSVVTRKVTRARKNPAAGYYWDTVSGLIPVKIIRRFKGEYEDQVEIEVTRTGRVFSKGHRTTVSARHVVSGDRVKRRKYSTVIRNPVPAFIIRVKLKTREHPFYFDGYRLDANRNHAQKYASLQQAKLIGQKVWGRFPSIATVGIHRTKA